MIAKTFMSERVGEFEWWASLSLSQQLQSQKNARVFLSLQRNREFKVLCSIHSTAFETEATRSEPRSMEFKSESVHSHL